MLHNETMNASLELFDLNQLGELAYGKFVSRPNRFVGEILVDGKSATCHIADTGRLKEILTIGRRILVAKNPPHLKTDYRLIACEMDEWVLINTPIHTHIARAAIRKGVLGVKCEDLFQLHTYIGQYGNGTSIKECGFVYPISEERWVAPNLDKTQGLISDVIRQQGQDIPFHVIFLKIPDNTSLDFNRLMSEQCRVFIDTIHSKILIKEKIAAWA